MFVPAIHSTRQQLQATSPSLRFGQNTTAGITKGGDRLLVNAVAIEAGRLHRPQRLWTLAQRLEKKGTQGNRMREPFHDFRWFTVDIPPTREDIVTLRSKLNKANSKKLTPDEIAARDYLNAIAPKPYKPSIKARIKRWAYHQLRTLSRSWFFSQARPTKLSANSISEGSPDLPWSPV